MQRATSFRQRMYDNITQCVGNTPIVKLQRIAKDCAATVAVKLESLNPAWSVKDRIAVNMIDRAEEENRINSETIIIEPTSGNTGIGLAFTCAARGYKLIVTMPETMSVERRRMLAAFGAQVILTPGDQGMNGAIRRAEELLASTPNAFMPQQFCNPANPEAHCLTTAEEIWTDTQGKIDILVSGVGTGGTLSGVGATLKKRKPSLKCYAVEPALSPVITQTRAGQPLQPSRHKIQGIGAGFVPENLDLTVIDGVLTVEDEQAFVMARRLAKEEGIMAGISSGAIAHAAVELGKKPESRSKLIVAIVCDLGERYLSTALYPDG